MKQSLIFFHNIVKSYIIILINIIILLSFSCSHNSELNIPLINAVKNNDLQLVKSFIEKGANINYKSSIDGSTPLFFSVINGNLDISKFLIDNGARIDLINNHNKSLLEIAYSQKNDNIKKLIIETFHKKHAYQGLIYFSYGSYARCNNILLFEKKQYSYNTFFYISCDNTSFFSNSISYDILNNYINELRECIVLLSKSTPIKNGSITTGPVIIIIDMPFCNLTDIKLSDQGLSTSSDYFLNFTKIDSTLMNFININKSIYRRKGTN